MHLLRSDFWQWQSWRPTRPQPVSHPRHRHARHALVAFVVGVLGLNLGLGLYAQWNARVRDPIYGDKATRLARKPAPVILGLGTSRLGFGFHSARIEARLTEYGLTASAFNFGVPASGPVTHLVYLKRRRDFTQHVR
jgi:hypothetical protein